MTPLMKRNRDEQSTLNRWVPIILMALLVTTAVQMLARSRLSTSLQSEMNQLGIARNVPDTLIIYIFSYTNPEYKENLLHFVRHGIREDDGCQYIIVIQTEEGAAVPPRSMKLPEVPSNVMYEFHPNGCYDWGTIGWVLENGRVNWRKFKYFIFMNSSVRGPFLPPAMQGLISWQELLLNKITSTVKLVGPTISCEGSPFEGNIAGEWRTNPHVQSYVIATDKVGLTAWMNDGKVFTCYQSMWDTIWYSELGSSLVLLNKGYNIDSLMLRYQGIDWRNKSNWGCNGGVNPYAQRKYDGINLNPMEVMFIKVKDYVLANDWEAARTAVKYATWQDEQYMYMKQRGSRCFDTTYYADANGDLTVLKTPEQLWEHWLYMGQFEGRPFRFTCVPPNEIPENPTT